MQRERGQAGKERQEENEQQERKQKHVPDWLRTLLKIKQQQCPGPDKLFRKDLNFGPKTKGHMCSDHQSSPSPSFSCSPLPDLPLEVRKNSLKRQRHDSSDADAAAKSPRDRLHSTSSPVPIQRPQPIPSVPKPLHKGCKTPSVHSGQHVEFTAPNLPDAVRSIENNVRPSVSDYNSDNILNCFKASTYGRTSDIQEYYAPTSPVGSPGCCSANLRHHLETASANK